MEGLVPDAGRFRNGNVGVFDGDVLIHAGTPAAHVPEVMADIFDWLNKRACTFGSHPASSISNSNSATPSPTATEEQEGYGTRCSYRNGDPCSHGFPSRSTIRQRQAGYYEALAKSDAIGSSERFVEFMLDAIRNSILPFSKPERERELTRSRTLDFFRERGDGSISQLAEHLGCSKRSAERIVAGLKEEGSLKGREAPGPEFGSSTRIDDSFRQIMHRLAGRGQPEIRSR